MRGESWLTLQGPPVTQKWPLILVSEIRVSTGRPSWALANAVARTASSSKGRSHRAAEMTTEDAHFLSKIFQCFQYAERGALRLYGQ